MLDPDNPTCEVGVAIDDLHAGASIPSVRVTFADMNADGVDDVVLIGAGGVWFIPVFQAIGAAAPQARPGLLARIDNGYGATTEIVYRSIQALDLEARKTPTPWTHHSPTVAQVVTSLKTESTLVVASGHTQELPPEYRIRRERRYRYRDPAYDAWLRQFVGFRKVMEERVGGGFDDATETTYWFGACQQDNLADDRDGTVRGLERCPDSSEDDRDKALIGRPVRIERLAPPLFNDDGRGRLSITMLSYVSPMDLFPGSERRVSFTYANEISTFLYDPDKTTALWGTPHPMPGASSLGDLLEPPRLEQGQNAPLRVQQLQGFNRYGDLTDSTDNGRLTLDQKPIDPPLKTSYEYDPCTALWQCLLKDTTTQLSPDSWDRQTRYTYNAQGDLTDVERFLEGSQGLFRAHEDPTQPTAPPPATASPPGWRNVLHVEYDRFGNVALLRGPGSPGRCTTFEYDAPFAEFVLVEHGHTDGCGSASLDTQRIFDQAFRSRCACATRTED